jgi:hypothetical protein
MLPKCVKSKFVLAYIMYYVSMYNGQIHLFKCHRIQIHDHDNFVTRQTHWITKYKSMITTTLWQDNPLNHQIQIHDHNNFVTRQPLESPWTLKGLQTFEVPSLITFGVSNQIFFTFRPPNDTLKITHEDMVHMFYWRLCNHLSTYYSLVAQIVKWRKWLDHSNDTEFGRILY